MAASDATPAANLTTLAPDSASSTDGMTRSMMALSYFQDAKTELDALPADDEKARKDFHLKWAKRCHDFAVDHGGVYSARAASSTARP